MRHVNGSKVPFWLADLRRANGDARRLVEELFHRALLTLDGLEDGDAHLFRVRTSWPKFPREWHAYSTDPDDAPGARFCPTPLDIDRYLEVLGWGCELDRQAWLICRDVALGYSTLATSERLHLPVNAVARRYEAAITMVCRAALGPA